MDLQLDGVVYRLIPVPPRLSPYSALIAELLRAKPQSVEEAERNSALIADAMQKLFAGTVTPMPRAEHETQVFNALIELTNSTLRDAELFREKFSGVQKGGAAEPAAAPSP